MVSAAQILSQRSRRSFLPPVLPRRGQDRLPQPGNMEKFSYLEVRTSGHQRFRTRFLGQPQDLEKLIEEPKRDEISREIRLRAVTLDLRHSFFENDPVIPGDEI